MAFPNLFSWKSVQNTAENPWKSGNFFYIRQYIAVSDGASPVDRSGRELSSSWIAQDYIV